MHKTPMLRRLILGCFFYLAFFSTASAFLPKSHAFPGGVAVVELPDPLDPNKPPTVTFQKQRVMVISNPDKHQWLAIVGLPMTVEPGIATIYLKSEKRGAHKVNFTIKRKSYPLRHIKIPESRKVFPTPEDMQRIDREGKLLEALLEDFSYKPISSLAIQKPVKGRRTNSFGLHRIMNGAVESRHTGLDLAAPIGTPVYAAAPGKVVLVADLFYSGNMVMIDHGQGWKTLYCHLNTTQVQIDDIVTQKTKIGSVGKTGRVTGPHLHFGMSLNNARVDPALFFAAN